METGILFVFYFLEVVVLFLLIVCIRKLINIESSVEDLEYKLKHGDINNQVKKINELPINACVGLQNSKDEIELRKYCLNNVPDVIGKKSYIAEADIIYHYITTGEMGKGSEASKKQEL